MRPLSPGSQNGAEPGPTGAAYAPVPSPAEAFFSHFADGLSDSVLILDETLTICAYNKASERIFGYPASLVLGKRVNILDRPMTLENGEHIPFSRFPGITALRSGRATEKIHISLTDSERNIHRVSLSAYPWSAAGDGHPTHVAVILADLTPLQLLTEHVDRLERVVNQAADAILILDERGIVREANPAFTRLTGIEAPEVVHGSLRLLEHKDRDRAAFSQMMEALVRGDVWSNRITHRSKQPDGIDCIGTLSPLYLKGGRLTGFVYMLRDMSHIVEMEKRLIRSQKMEAIGTLAGGIAHDFNNILHSISGYTELAFAAEGDTRVKGYLENVLAACERAGGLVRQILTFSRREERARKPVMIQSELEKAVKFIRVTLPATAEIQADIDCDDAAVLGDATELHQIIINLLTNAYQALKDGSGRISIVARCVNITQQSPGSRSSLNFGPYVSIVIRDNGKGIQAEIIDRIFEPFFTTKPVNEGTGMGLSIVHGIVSSMNGDISVESAPGAGTTFTLLLPRTDGAIEETPHELHRQRRGSESVLVIDDEQVITDMIAEVLSALGYQVTVDNDPESALARFTENPAAFDIVISDQTMPRMTGLQLAEKMAAIRRDLPILLCTGNGDRDLTEKAREIGVAQLLHKPLRLSAITSIVRATLDATGAHAKGEPAVGAAGAVTLPPTRTIPSDLPVLHDSSMNQASPETWSGPV